MAATPRGVAAFLFLALLTLPGGAHGQSLGELARKERERKGATTAGAEVLTNEEVRKPILEEYPSVQARFTMPMDWEKPVPRNHLVLSPCPGATLPAAEANAESAICALVVGVDGPSNAARENAGLALDRMQAELLAKTKGQVEPWRPRELGGMPARETVLVVDTPGVKRHMRLVMAVHPGTGLIYIVALMAVPERFTDVAPALDTVLATFEPAPKVPAPRVN